MVREPGRLTDLGSRAHYLRCFDGQDIPVNKYSSRLSKGQPQQKAVDWKKGMLSEEVFWDQTGRVHATFRLP